MQILRALQRQDDWKELEPVDVMFVCHDADRTWELDGRRYAPVIDTIQDALAARGLRGLTIAAPYSTATGELAHGRVLGFNRSFAANRLAATARRSAEVGDSYTWTRILATAKPRGLIAIQPPRGLCEAARDAGVWVADAQHGWIPSTDFAAEPYYTRRYWSVNGSDPFPDYFLVWDDSSAENLRRVFAPRRVRTLRIGNLWCERFLRKDPDDPIASSGAWQSSTHRRRILVTLQWKVVTALDSLPPALQAAIRETCSEFDWVIRLHPCHEESADYASIRRSLTSTCGDRVVWQVPSDQPLPALLSGVDLHITYNSSSALEASYFNIITGFVDRRVDVLRSGMSHLLDDGLAEVIPEDAASIAQWIVRQMSTAARRPRMPADQTGDGASALMSLFA